MDRNKKGCSQHLWFECFPSETNIDHVSTSAALFVVQCAAVNRNFPHEHFKDVHLLSVDLLDGLMALALKGGKGKPIERGTT